MSLTTLTARLARLEGWCATTQPVEPRELPVPPEAWWRELAQLIDGEYAEVIWARLEEQGDAGAAAT